MIAFGPKIDPSLEEFFALSHSRDAMASFRHVFMSCGRNLRDEWERRVQPAADEQRLERLHSERMRRYRANMRRCRANWKGSKRNSWPCRASIGDLQLQLAQARGKPLKVVGDYLQYQFLDGVLKLNLPFSARESRTLRKKRIQAQSATLASQRIATSRPSLRAADEAAIGARA